MLDKRQFGWLNLLAAVVCRELHVKPTLSIALTTCNGDKYLAPQLKSLAEQRLPICELVIGDDGSTDQTLSKLRKFADTAPFPVTLFENTTRLGYRLNFMRVASACSGDLIAFCDQDDIWHADKTKAVLNAFADSETMLTFHNAVLIDHLGRPIRKLFRGRRPILHQRLSTAPWMIVPGLVQTFRRSLLRFASLHSLSIDPYRPEERMPHDLWYPFWASVLGRIAYIPDILVQYRQHDGNTSGWYQSRYAYLRDNISNAEAYTLANALNTGNKLKLLKAARPLVDNGELKRVEEAIGFYERLNTLGERRIDIYRGSTIVRRASVLAALLRKRAYAHSFGYDALVLDALIGVPFARAGRVNH